MATTPKAKCANCGTARPKSRLRAAPDGGAVCVDWFTCQQKRDEKNAEFRAKLAKT